MSDLQLADSREMASESMLELMKKLDPAIELPAQGATVQ